MGSGRARAGVLKMVTRWGFGPIYPFFRRVRRSSKLAISRMVLSVGNPHPVLFQTSTVERFHWSENFVHTSCDPILGSGLAHTQFGSGMVGVM